MSTIATLFAEAEKLAEFERSLGVPPGVQLMLDSEREHRRVLEWKREYDQAYEWQATERRNAADQLAVRLAIESDARRAIEQATQLRAIVAAAQPPAWMQSDRTALDTANALVALGHHAQDRQAEFAMASNVHGAFASRALQDWMDVQNTARKQFAVIEDLTRSTWLMHDQLMRWARDEADSARYLAVAMEPAIVKLIRREGALHRAAHSLVDQVASTPSLIFEYPDVLRGASFVSPNTAARATLAIVSPDDVDLDDARIEETRELEAMALTRQERNKRLAALHESIPESLAGAREALTLGGPRFATKCVVCLRLAFDSALDVVAPMKAVAQWESPRCTMREDGKGPTRAARLFYAFRNLPSSHAAARFMEADVMVTNTLMDSINAIVHRPGGEQDVAQLDIYVQRMETHLLVLASLPR